MWGSSSSMNFSYNLIKKDKLSDILRLQWAKWSISSLSHLVLWNRPSSIPNYLNISWLKSHYQHQQMTWYSRSWQTPEYFILGFKRPWIMWLSSLPPNFRSLISKLNKKFTFTLKEFVPLTNNSLLALDNSSKMQLTLSLVQEWLDSRNVIVVAPFPMALDALTQVLVQSLWRFSEFFHRLSVTVLSRLQFSSIKFSSI